MYSGTTYLGKNNRCCGECFLQTSNISLKDPLYCKVFYFDTYGNLNTLFGQKNKIDFGESRYLGMGIRGVFNKNLIK